MISATLCWGTTLPTIITLIVTIIRDGGSESEAEDVEGHVTLPQDMPGRGNLSQQQSAIRLYEVHTPFVN